MTYMRDVFCKFRKDEQGTISVELVLILPVLFWAYLSMFSIFDAYRQHSLNQKASYTLGDVISRETAPIDNNYLSGTREMLAYLTANETTDVALRITSVTYDADTDEYKKFWSKN